MVIDLPFHQVGVLWFVVGYLQNISIFYKKICSSSFTWLTSGSGRFNCAALLCGVKEVNKVSLLMRLKARGGRRENAAFSFKFIKFTGLFLKVGFFIALIMAWCATVFIDRIAVVFIIGRRVMLFIVGPVVECVRLFVLF